MTLDTLPLMGQRETILAAESALGIGPVALARAMGVVYDTYKNWRSERTTMPPVAVRCLELLLMYPRTAKRLSDSSS